MELFKKTKEIITSIEARRSFDNSLEYIKTLLSGQEASNKKTLLEYIQEVIKRGSSCGILSSNIL